MFVRKKKRILNQLAPSRKRVCKRISKKEGRIPDSLDSFLDSQGSLGLFNGSQSPQRTHIPLSQKQAQLSLSLNVPAPLSPISSLEVPNTSPLQLTQRSQHHARTDWAYLLSPTPVEAHTLLQSLREQLQDAVHGIEEVKRSLSHEAIAEVNDCLQSCLRYTQKIADQLGEHQLGDGNLQAIQQQSTINKHANIESYKPKLHHHKDTNLQIYKRMRNAHSVTKKFEHGEK